MYHTLKYTNRTEVTSFFSLNFSRVLFPWRSEGQMRRHQRRLHPPSSQLQRAGGREGDGCDRFSVRRQWEF